MFRVIACTSGEAEGPNIWLGGEATLFRDCLCTLVGVRRTIFYLLAALILQI